MERDSYRRVPLRERFVARVVFWSAEQYEKQWESALRKIVIGSTPAALITDYVEPNLSSADSLWWWPLYREGDSVYIQNQLRMLYRKGDSCIYAGPTGVLLPNRSPVFPATSMGIN